MSYLADLLEYIVKYRVRRPLFMVNSELDNVFLSKFVQTLRATQCVTHLILLNAQIESFGLLCDFLKEKECVIRKAVFFACALVGNDGEPLGRALEVNRTLRRLNLSQNNLLEKGVLCIAQGLQHNHTLEHLNISSTGCGMSAVGEVLRHGKWLKKLNAGFNRRLDGNDGADPDDDVVAIVEPLKEHKCLETLLLFCNKFNIHCIAKIAGALKVNKSIKKIDLSCNSTEGAGVIMCDVLKANPTLTSVDLGCCNLGFADALAFADVLTMSYLKELRLFSNSLQEEGIKAISEALKENHTLKMLNLANGPGVTGAIYLDNLTLLDLGLNFLGLAPGRLLGESLKRTRSLRVLVLNHSMPGGREMHLLCEGIKANTSLWEIHLNQNELDSSCARFLKDALVQHKSVTKLDLSMNELGPAGAKELAEMLRVNKSLKHVDFSDNNFQSDEGCFIFDALTVNSSLETINMGYNDLGHMDVAKSIAKMLQINRTLFKLSAILNDFGVEELTVIAEALKVNQGLTGLELLLKTDREKDIFRNAIALNENVTIDSRHVVVPKVEYMRLARIDESIMAFLCIRKHRNSPLNQHPKEVIVMIADFILKTKDDPSVWRKMN